MSLSLTVRLVVESASPQNRPAARHTGDPLSDVVVFRVEIPAPTEHGGDSRPNVLGYLRYEHGGSQPFVNGQVFETSLSFNEIKAKADKAAKAG